MASYTTNYHLKKPASGENYSVTDQNGNMDILDGAIKTVSDRATGSAAQILDYIETSGTTKTYTLETGKGYLVAINRLNVNNPAELGLYFAQIHMVTSVLAPILSAANVTVSVSGTTLTIVTGTNYVGVGITRIA